MPARPNFPITFSGCLSRYSASHQGNAWEGSFCFYEPNHLSPAGKRNFRPPGRGNINTKTKLIHRLIYSVQRSWCIIRYFVAWRVNSLILIHTYGILRNRQQNIFQYCFCKHIYCYTDFSVWPRDYAGLTGTIRRLLLYLYATKLIIGYLYKVNAKIKFERVTRLQRPENYLWIMNRRMNA